MRPSRTLVFSIQEARPPASMVTKRQLGMFVTGISLLSALGIVMVDIFGAGQWGGFGPLQRIGIGAGLGGLLVGLILIRLGDRPA